MAFLPLIVGFGGYGPAGRSSFHNAYSLTALDSLPDYKISDTLLGLATMMKLVEYKNETYIDSDGNNISPEAVVEKYREDILNGTLIRTLYQKPSTDKEQVHCDVSAAAQLPEGFQPANFYASKNHPKGLQMTVLAASDAIMSLGIPWRKITDAIDPTDISVYAGSLMSQLDEHGLGGMMQANLKGRKVRAKNLPLGLISMPSDFVNAYVIGSLGKTGGTNGACATFLYNLDRAVTDIKYGKSKVAIVGNSEAPITPEVIEGFAAMGALATDTKLKQIHNSEDINFKTASRPFGDNCGFILAESAQYIILMADDLAIELGAQVHGSVGEVFIAADGFKSSISSPGPGNYITMAKAVASAQHLLGEESVQKHSFVQAHGSSTPQNRTSESEILSKIASSMGIDSWPITAVKSYVGHSLSAASADQTINSLGVFEFGVLPGIKSNERLAQDITSDHLSIKLADTKREFDVSFINSKGFGGNNASAYIISPNKTKKLLRKKHDKSTLKGFEQKQKKVKIEAERYNIEATKGRLAAIYTPKPTNLSNQDIEITNTKIKLGDQSVKLREGTE